MRLGRLPSSRAFFLLRRSSHVFFLLLGLLPPSQNTDRIPIEYRLKPHKIRYVDIIPITYRHNSEEIVTQTQTQVGFQIARQTQGHTSGKRTKKEGRDSESFLSKKGKKVDEEILPAPGVITIFTG